METLTRVFIFNQGGGLLTTELIEACNDFQVFALVPSKGHKSTENVVLVDAPKFNNQSVAQRVISWLRYFYVALRFVLKVKTSDIVVLSTNPPIMQMMIPIIKIKRAKVVYWVLDLYPDALWCGLKMAKNSIIPLAWSFVNKISFRRADIFVSLSKSMCRAVSKYLRDTNRQRVVWLPTWVDTKKIHPVSRENNELAKQLGLKDKFVIVYSGNIGATHDLSFLPRLAQKLANHQSIQFLIVGSGSSLVELKKSCSSLANVAFLPPQTVEKLCEAMSIGHLAIVSQGENTGSVSMPSKTYYYMACGCVILGVAPIDSGVTDVVRKYDCGACFLPDQVPLMADFIVRLMNNSSLLSIYSQNSLKAVKQEFSSDICLKSFTNLLKTLSHGGSRNNLPK